MISVGVIGKTEVHALEIARWCVCSESINGELAKKFDVSGMSAEIQAHPLALGKNCGLPRVDAVLIAYDGSEDFESQIQLFLNLFDSVLLRFVYYGEVEPRPDLEQKWNCQSCPKDSPSIFAEKLIRGYNTQAKLVKAIFDTLDTGSKGYLTVDDLLSLAAKMEVVIRDIEATILLHSLDRNQDGKVHLSEFIEWWKCGRLGLASKLSFLIMDLLAKDSHLNTLALSMAEYGGFPEIKQPLKKILTSEMKLRINNVAGLEGLLHQTGIINIIFHLI